MPKNRKNFAVKKWYQRQKSGGKKSHKKIKSAIYSGDCLYGLPVLKIKIQLLLMQVNLK